MKNCFIICIAVLLIASCKKHDVDLLLGGLPEERISDSINKLKSTLTEAEDGWIGVLNTVAVGGYGFYIQFNEDETLEMLMDGNPYISEESAEDFVKSTYRVKHVMTTSLLFDTYNYLTLLHDPAPEVAGGIPGAGYGSDVDFELVRYSIDLDTVHLKGKKYGNAMMLYKATSSQKERYWNNGYMEAIEKTYDFFDPLGANYYEANINGNEASVQISLNNTTKSLSFIALDGSADTLMSVSAPFAYSIDGVDFGKQVNFLDKDFTKIRNENGRFYLYDVTNEKYEVMYSSSQIISLKYALGASIKEIELPGPYQFNSILPLESWSQTFVTEWDDFVYFSKNGGYNLTIGNGFYTFDGVNKRINVEMSIYQGTIGFTATMRYDYGFTDGGDIKFTDFAPINGNAGIIAPYLNNTIHKRMLADSFEMGYVLDPNFGKLIKFTSKENPDFYFSMIIN